LLFLIALTVGFRVRRGKRPSPNRYDRPSTQDSELYVTSAGEPEAAWPLGGDGPAPPPATVGVADLRATNAAAVLAAVRAAAKPPRLASLAEATKLSRPTVELLVEDLSASGLIEEVAATPARGVRSPGRPARRFRFQPRAGYVVGVDVRPRSVAACLADLDGEPVAVHRRAVRADLTGRARAAAVVAVARDAMQRAGVTPRRVCAATIGTPGLVERGNVRIRYVDNLKGWADAGAAELLAGELDCPVAVENDANLAALGERWRGLDPAVTEMIFILIADRLGAGIITGGRLLRGHHGAAGEIGFIHFPGRGLADPPGLVPVVDPGVIDGAARGDTAATRALESVGRRLVEGIAPVLLALDPEVVVLGTGLFARPHLAPAAAALLAAAADHAGTLLVDPPQWRLSGLGDEAILTGAVRFALSAVERVLLTRPTTLFA
jgi:predicted NBD/HSP70 family sugar kinase